MTSLHQQLLRRIKKINSNFKITPNKLKIIIQTQDRHTTQETYSSCQVTQKILKKTNVKKSFLFILKSEVTDDFKLFTSMMPHTSLNQQFNFR